MKPAYEVIVRDLALARSSPGERIVADGQPISVVCVLDFPAGAGLSIAFGSNAPPIPLLTVGQTFDDNGCVFCDEGMFLLNPAGAGLVTLYVGYGTGAAGVSS